MQHFGISDEEATKCLLQVIGPDERFKQFWSRFVTKPKTADKDAMEVEAAEKKQNAPDVQASRTAQIDSKVPQADAPKTETQSAKGKPTLQVDSDDDEEDDFPGGGPGPDDDEDDEDLGELCSTTSSNNGRPDPPTPPVAVAVAAESALIDTMETQPIEEPVLAHIPSKPDEAELARLELAKRLRSAPTPAKAMEKEVGSR
jgi:hypothetical protein